MNAIFFIIFHISIVHLSQGSTVGEDTASVDSSNPDLDLEHTFIEFFGSKEQDKADTCEKLIESRGFEYERHYITTKDGYILQNFRIINPYAKEARKSLKPVLLLHPLFAACGVWLFNSPGGHIKPWIDGIPPNDTSASLGFLLANLGYDVWLINVRGTSYSTNHTHLDPKDPKFWDFSVTEIGLYDVTSTVEYIKKETGFEKIIAVGHSQGTIQMLIQLSVLPESQEDYDIVILAAPIGFLGDKSGFYGVLPTVLLKRLFSLKDAPFPPFSPIFFGSLAVFCEKPAFIPVCDAIIQVVFGIDPQQLNTSRIDVYASHLDRTSNKNIVHLFQAIEKNHFSWFDYGKEKNYALYGTAEPPRFPYHKINPDKLALISSLNDRLATPINVHNLRNSFVSKTRDDYIIRYPYFNHGDFLIALEAFPFFAKIASQIIRDQMSRN